MAYFCFKCQKENTLTNPQQVGRRDTCQHCGSDLHACLNCRNYDRSAYNECREPQADRVLDKDRSNFCDYFSFRESAGPGLKVEKDKKADVLKGLDALFKK